MSTALRIAIRCDASAEIGGGHTMRCLTLANALSDTGASVTFAAAAMPDALAERIRGAGHALKLIPQSPEMEREGERWEEPPLSSEAQLADAKATGEAVGKADWIVVDHYLLDARWHSAARAFAADRRDSASSAAVGSSVPAPELRRRRDGLHDRRLSLGVSARQRTARHAF